MNNGRPGTSDLFHSPPLDVWFLRDDANDLDAILERLGLGAEVHLSSAWDLEPLSGGEHDPEEEAAQQVRARGERARDR